MRPNGIGHTALLLACVLASGGCAGPGGMATPAVHATAAASQTSSPATVSAAPPSASPSAGHTLPPADPRVAGTWDTAPSMQHPRGAHAVVSTDDAIFALAGTGDGRPVLEVERFDGTAWTVETTLPGDGLNAPAAVALDGLVYLIGGFATTTNVPVADVAVYDPATGRWASAAPLPSPRGGHAAVVLDGRIHVLGGGNATTTLDDHDVYDPASDTWQSAAPLPRREGSPAATILDGRLHAIGGRSGLADFGAVDIYDASTDAWSGGPAIPPRGTAGAATYCDAIYLFGGESQREGRRLADVLRLEPGGSWEAASSMPTGRAFARSVVFAGAVYVVGGNTTSGASHASPGSTVVGRFEVDCPAG